MGWSCTSVTQRHTNADLKISIFVPIDVKIIPWKFCILNPKNFGVIVP